jgi:hypothetical protein
MTETNICSEETTSGPKRSLGTTPTLLVALLQRFQSVGLDRCGWVGGWDGGTYRKRSETQGKARGVMVGVQRKETEAGYFECVVLPWIEICFKSLLMHYSTHLQVVCRITFYMNQ